MLAKEKNNQTLETLLQHFGATEQTPTPSTLFQKSIQLLKRLFQRIKDLFNRIFLFVTKQRQFSAELEQTWVYVIWNIIRSFVVPLFSYVFAGPVIMVGHFFKQLSLYLSGPILAGGTTLYYKSKPYVHNYAYAGVERGFDMTATLFSSLAHGALKAHQLYDYVLNPVRSVAASSMAYLFGNVAARYTANKNMQAAFYVLGREAGYLLVDSYHVGAQPKEPGRFDEQLNQGLVIWSSLLGRDTGERFIYSLHSITQLQEALHDNIGWLEHAVIGAGQSQLNNLYELLPSFTHYGELERILTAIKELSLPYQTFRYSADEIYHKLLQLQRELGYRRDALLQELEGWINNNVLPEGEYKTQANLYLERTKLLLLSQKNADALSAYAEAESRNQTAQNNLAKCQDEQEKLLQDPSATEFERNRAQEKVQEATLQVELTQQSLDEAKATVDSLAEQLTEQTDTLQALWGKTPKGICVAALTDAEKEVLEVRKTLEEYKMDLYFLEQQSSDEQKLAEAHTKIAETEAKLAQSVQNLEELKTNYFEVSTSLEKSDYLARELKNLALFEESIADYKKRRIDLSAGEDELYQSIDAMHQTNIALLESEHEYNTLQQEIDVLDKKIFALDHPVSFDYVRYIREALKVYPDDADIKTYLLLKLAATGMIDYAEADKRLGDSLTNALASHNHKEDNLKALFEFQWLQLFLDYKPSLINARSKLIVRRDKAHDKYLNDLESHNQAIADYEKAKENLFNLLPPEARDTLEMTLETQRSTQENAIWKSTHNTESLKFVLGVLGQPILTFETAHYTTGLFNPSANKAYGAFLVANWLIDYKYLFLPAPNAVDKRAEALALASELEKISLTPNSIADIKLKIDGDISQQLFDSAKNQTPQSDSNYAQNICSSLLGTLQRGINYQFSDLPPEIMLDGKPVCEAVIEALHANDDQAVVSIMTQAINETVKAVSVEIHGVVKPSPAPTLSVPEFKSRHLFWNRIRGFFVDIAAPILANGVSFVVTGSTVMGGFTKDNLYKLFSRDKPAVPPPAPKPETSLWKAPHSGGSTTPALDIAPFSVPLFDSLIALDSPPPTPLALTSGSGFSASSLAIQPYHSPEPVNDPSIYSSFLGSIAEPLDSTPRPLIFSQSAGLIASNNTQDALTAPEPEAPKKPFRATIEEIEAEPAPAKPVSIPSTESSTRPVVEALFTTPKAMSDNPLTTVIAAFSGSTRCESDKDCVRPPPASIKPSPVKAQSPEMDFMDKQWQQSIDDLYPKHDAAYYAEEFDKPYGPAPIRPSHSQTPAGQLLSEATSQLKGMRKDPLELALSSYTNTQKTVSDSDSPSSDEMVSQSHQATIPISMPQGNFVIFLNLLMRPAYASSAEASSSNDRYSWDNFKQTAGVIYDTVDQFSLAACFPYVDNIVLNTGSALLRSWVGYTFDGIKHLLFHGNDIVTAMAPHLMDAHMGQHLDKLSEQDMEGLIHRNHQRGESLSNLFVNLDESKTTFLEGDLKYQLEFLAEGAGFFISCQGLFRAGAATSRLTGSAALYTGRSLTPFYDSSKAIGTTAASILSSCELKVLTAEMTIAQTEKATSQIIKSSTRISSNTVNKEFLTEEALAKKWQPPYPANLSLRHIVLAVETKFYRVHTDFDFPTGRFLVRESEVARFLNNPEALRLHLGLPNVPIYITEVYVPVEASLIVGRIGPQPAFGLMEKTGFQYQLVSQIEKSCFINTRPLIKPKPSPTKRYITETTLEY